MSRKVLRGVVERITGWIENGEGKDALESLEEVRDQLTALLQARRPRPRFLLDIDGVITDIIGASLPFINQLTDRVFIHDDVCDYKMEIALGLNADQRIALYETWKTRGFCRDLKPYAGALEAVARLQSLGDVFAVTRPLPESDFWIPERYRWLYSHCEIPEYRVIQTDAKYTIDGDVLIEDNAKNLGQWQQDHPDGLGILFDRPYNRTQDWTGLRVRTWPEVFEAIAEHQVML